MPSYPIGSESDFRDGQKHVLIVGDLEVGVFRLDGRLFAWRNVCPHQGGPVCQGGLFRRVVEAMDDNDQVRGRRYHETDVHIVCPWHGAEFDIRTGRHAGTDQLRLQPIGIELRQGEVYLNVDSRAE